MALISDRKSLDCLLLNIFSKPIFSKVYRRKHPRFAQENGELRRACRSTRRIFCCLLRVPRTFLHFVHERRWHWAQHLNQPSGSDNSVHSSDEIQNGELLVRFWRNFDFFRHDRHQHCFVCWRLHPNGDDHERGRQRHELAQRHLSVDRNLRIAGACCANCGLSFDPLVHWLLLQAPTRHGKVENHQAWQNSNSTQWRDGFLDRLDSGHHRHGLPVCLHHHDRHFLRSLHERLDLFAVQLFAEKMWVLGVDFYSNFRKSTFFKVKTKLIFWVRYLIFSKNLVEQNWLEKSSFCVNFWKLFFMKFISQQFWTKNDFQRWAWKTHKIGIKF